LLLPFVLPLEPHAAATNASTSTIAAPAENLETRLRIVPIAPRSDIRRPVIGQLLQQ
jgi:hypothetical protein